MRSVPVRVRLRVWILHKGRKECGSNRAHGKTGSKRLEVVQSLSVVICPHRTSFKSKNTLLEEQHASLVQTQSLPWSVDVAHG